jgi:cholesterol transport system auxiliary component
MRRPLLACLLAVAAAIAGCAFAPAAEQAVTTSLLDQLPAEVPHRTTASPLTLVVFPPEARPAVDTMQMAYAAKPHQLAYYAHNQWAETPPQMLQPLLVRTLEATGAFHAVVSPPVAGMPVLALRTDVVELVQDYTQEPPVLRLALRVRLADERTRNVLGTREVVVQEPMQQQGPDAGVRAANAAMARALRDVAQFVLEKAP